MAIRRWFRESLSRREQALVYLLCAVCLGLGLYYGIHDPLFQWRGDVATRLQETSSELALAKTRLQREGDLDARSKALATREQQSMRTNSGESSAARLVWHLSQSAAHTGTRVIAIGTQDPKATTSGGQAAAPGGQAAKAGSGTTDSGQPPAALREERVTIKVQGAFQSLLQFTQELERMPLMVKLNALDLSLSEGTGVAGAAAATRTLTATYQISLFFQNEKGSPAQEGLHFPNAPGRSNPFEPAGPGR